MVLSPILMLPSPGRRRRQFISPKQECQSNIKHQTQTDHNVPADGSSPARSKLSSQRSKKVECTTAPPPQQPPSMKSSTEQSRLPLSPRSTNNDNIKTTPKFSIMRSRSIKKSIGVAVGGGGGGAFFGRKNGVTNGEAGNPAPSHPPPLAVKPPRGFKVLSVVKSSQGTTPRNVLRARNQETKTNGSASSERQKADKAFSAVALSDEKRGPAAVSTDINSERGALGNVTSALLPRQTKEEKYVPLHIRLRDSKLPKKEKVGHPPLDPNSKKAKVGSYSGTAQLTSNEVCHVGDMNLKEGVEKASYLSNNATDNDGGVVTKVINLLPELDGLCSATERMFGLEAADMVVIGPNEPPRYVKRKDHGDDKRPIGSHGFTSRLGTTNDEIQKRDSDSSDVNYKVPFISSWPLTASDTNTITITARAKREKQQAIAGAISRGQVAHERSLHHAKEQAEYELERVSTKADMQIEYYRTELKLMETKLEQLKKDMQQQEEHCHVQEEMANRELEKAHQDQAREELKSKRLKAKIEAESEQNRNLKSQIIQLKLQISDKASLADDGKTNDAVIEMNKEEAERTITAQIEEQKAFEEKYLCASRQNSGLKSQINHLTKEIQSAVAQQQSLNEEVQRAKEEADAHHTIATEKDELEEQIRNTSHQNGVLKDQVSKLTTEIATIQMTAQKMIDAQNDKLKRMQNVAESFKANAINPERKSGDGESSENIEIDLTPSHDIKSSHPSQHAVEVEYFSNDVEVLSCGDFAAAGRAYKDALLPSSGDTNSTSSANVMLSNDNSTLASSATSLDNSSSNTVKVEKGNITWFRKLMANSFSEADENDDSRTMSTLGGSVASKMTALENNAMVNNGCGSKTTIEGVVRSRSKKLWPMSHSSKGESDSVGSTVATAEEESTRSDLSEAASLNQIVLSGSSSNEKPRLSENSNSWTTCTMTALPNDNSILASSATSLPSIASTAVKVEKGKIAWFRKLMASSFSEADDGNNSRTVSTFSGSLASNETAPENTIVVDNGFGSKTTIEGVVRCRSKNVLPDSGGRGTQNSYCSSVTSADNGSTCSDRSKAASLGQSVLSVSSGSEDQTEAVPQSILETWMTSSNDGGTLNRLVATLDTNESSPLTGDTKEDRYRHTANDEQIVDEGAHNSPTHPESVDGINIESTGGTAFITSVPEETIATHCKSVPEISKKTPSNILSSSNGSYDVAHSNSSSCEGITFVSSKKTMSYSLSESGYISTATSSTETGASQRSMGDEGRSLIDLDQIC